jgi:hypothetical protein
MSIAKLSSKKWNRRQFISTTAAASSLAVLPSARGHMLANDEIRLGFISCGGRAGEHMTQFNKMGGVKIAGLCDPDQLRISQAARTFAQDAKTWADLRGMIDDKDIDAVVVSACNHWHCLASIWAMQAGKDVYVEKPLSHSQWEGRQTVNAARKYKRICQVGTQQRSDPMQAEIKKFLHQDKALGAIRSARVNRYGVRGSIGLRTTPLSIDPNTDYNLWLGPAQDKPIYRNNLHYDWHWDWNTGSGEMGNWGVHVLDDLRNNVFLDKVTLPIRILGGGARVVWNDAGETPNVHFVYFDTGSIPVVLGLSNLPESPSSKNSPQVPGPGSGYIAYCEGGRLEGERGKAVAFDNEGKKIRSFSGNFGNPSHHENFVQALRTRDASILNADVEVGHHTSGWCNLANIAYRVGSQFSSEKAAAIDMPEWTGLIQEMDKMLGSYNIKMDSGAIKLGPVLTIDPKSETFVGAGSEAANALLKREYRAPFVVPEIT